MKEVESFVKLIPLGSIFLIFCSSLKLLVYYNFFGINIEEFMGIHEYINYFIDDLFYYITMLGFTILFVYLRQTKWAKKFTKKYKGKGLSIGILGFVCAFILTILKAVFEERMSLRLLYLEVAIHNLFGIIYVTAFYFGVKLNFNIGLVILFLLYVRIDASSEAYAKTENFYGYKYIIEFKDKSYETSDSLRYLGKTEKFIFLYDNKTKESKIIPNNDLIAMKVIRLKIKKNENIPTGKG
ncbi:hypothetical protein [Snuella lapsa]|uniref:DUF5673 domain-containing protein n=1 Tax=Snuella lapsa TaxID=870481 RepID=A0ABP6WYX8_9FLAO